MRFQDFIDFMRQRLIYQHYIFVCMALFDEFERVFGEVEKIRQRFSERMEQYGDKMDKVRGKYYDEDTVSIVKGRDTIDIYVELPKHKKEDIKVYVVDWEINIEVDDITKAIPVPVNANKESLVAKYENDVLVISMNQKEGSGGAKIPVD